MKKIFLYQPDQYDRKQIAQIPDDPGVYLFTSKDNGKIIYIGKANNLKKRVCSYFRKKSNIGSKTRLLVENIDKIQVVKVMSELEALLLEAKLIRELKPKYNSVHKYASNYIYVKITDEEYPRVILTREAVGKGTFFGPFLGAAVVRDILSSVREVFPFCSQKAGVKKKCFYSYLGLCQPCPFETRLLKDSHLITTMKKRYLENIKQLKYLFEGQFSKIEKIFFKKMQRYSDNEQYEDALIYRERITKLHFLLSKYRYSDLYLKKAYLSQRTSFNETRKLTVVLKKYYSFLSNLSRIECYDVSHISGKLATGSLVTFINGMPEKKYYRRFMIRSKLKINDPVMIEEVLERRFGHEEWGYPDLIIVDGGKPQLGRAVRYLKNNRFKIPIIAIAKRVETLIIPFNGCFLELNLSHDSGALHLIQRIRDEAHRFAHKYHQYLRLKYLFTPERIRTIHTDS